MPPGRWDDGLGDYLLEDDAVGSAPDPEVLALDFDRRVLRHACTVCGRDETLSGSAEGRPPPVT